MNRGTIDEGSDSLLHPPLVLSREAPSPIVRRFPLCEKMKDNCIPNDVTSFGMSLTGNPK